MAGYAAWQSGDHSRGQKDFRQAAQYEEQKQDARKALKQIKKMASR